MLSECRKFISPEPGDDWDAIAARVLKDEAVDAAITKLKSWNLHLFARMPPGEFLGSDVIFTEPPREGDGLPDQFLGNDVTSVEPPLEGDGLDG